MNMGYSRFVRENRTPKRAEREWRIFADAGMLYEWMHALAHQNVGVCVLEKHVTDACVRVLVEYC